MKTDDIAKSLLEWSKCSYKDCGKTVYPHMIVFGTSPNHIEEIKRFLASYIRFYCEQHFHEIEQKEKNKKMVEILKTGRLN